MSNKNRQLGSGLEQRVVSRAKKLGLSARVQPGSGMFKDYPNDVLVWPSGRPALLGECKVRSTHPSFNEMAEWLQGAEANAKKAGWPGAFLVYNPKGSRHPVVMLDLDLFLSLLQNVVLDTETRDVA